MLRISGCLIYFHVNAHRAESEIYSFIKILTVKEKMELYDGYPVHKQPFDNGGWVYQGTSFVSYALTIAITVATFIAWWLFIGISIDDNRVFYRLEIDAVILIFFRII